MKVWCDLEVMVSHSEVHKSASSCEKKLDIPVVTMKEGRVSCYRVSSEISNFVEGDTDLEPEKSWLPA